jgi:hypothetical protein
LRNGNTLICEGGHGDFTEVTPTGEIVWKYICPVDDNGPMTQGEAIPTNPVRPDETMNSVFRVYRYSQDYAAFIGKDMTPGNFIEIYPQGLGDESCVIQSLIRLDQNHPNPFKTSTAISFHLAAKSQVNLTVYDIFGRVVSVLCDETKNPGEYYLSFDGYNLPTGIYTCILSAGSYSETKRMLIIR